MKRSAKYILSLVVLMMATGVSVAAAPSDEAKRTAALLRSMFSPGGPFGDIRPSDSTVPDQADTSPVPQSISDQDLEKSLQTFSRAFYVSEFMGKARIEIDTFLLPNARTGNLTVNWKSVKTVSGKEVMATEQEKQPESSLPAIPTTMEIALNGFTDEDPLHEAHGEATLELPTKFDRIEMDEKGKGRKIQLGSLELELLLLQNDVYRIKVRNLKGEDLSPDGLQVLPSGKQGRLKLKEQSEGPADLVMPEIVSRAIADLESGRRTADQVGEEFNAHKEEIEKAAQGSSRIYTGRAAGEIRSLLIVMPVTRTKRTFQVVATTEPKLEGEEEGKQPVASAPRYKNAPSPSFVSLSEAELRKEIRINATRSNAMFGFNTPEIECVLPAASNSHYATIGFSNAKLLNATSKTVPFELEESGYMAESHSSEIRFLKKNGSGFPEFARATGSVHIRYPMVVKTSSYKSGEGENPYNVVISGMKVAYRSDSDHIPESSSGPVSPVRAYDATGRELIRLSYTSMSDNDGETVTTVAFWGEPVRVEIDSVEEWAELNLQYNLPPAKKLPSP